MKNTKPSLSWTEEDYKEAKVEAPNCVLSGITEGESMDIEDITRWVSDTLRCIRVLADEYPQKAEEQIAEYKLDLNYLQSLGKITEEQFEQLTDEENFNFE